MVKGYIPVLCNTFMELVNFKMSPLMMTRNCNIHLAMAKIKFANVCLHYNYRHSIPCVALYMLSATIGLYPAFTSVTIQCIPIYPAPPVMRIFFPSAIFCGY